MIPGFIIIDRHGEFLAWSEHVEVATRRMRDDDMRHAAQVVRASNGAPITVARTRVAAAPAPIPPPAPAREPKPAKPVKLAIVRAPRAPRPQRVPMSHGRPRLDLSGVRFGRLAAVRDVGEPGARGHRPWLCVCDCGVEVVKPAWRLRSGDVRSCGCLRKDMARERSAAIAEARRAS